MVKGGREAKRHTKGEINTEYNEGKRDGGEMEIEKRQRGRRRRDT